MTTYILRDRKLVYTQHPAPAVAMVMSADMDIASELDIGCRGHLGLQNADALLLEVVEEALALQESARQLRTVLQQPRAAGVDDWRKRQVFVGACDMQRCFKVCCTHDGCAVCDTLHSSRLAHQTQVCENMALASEDNPAEDVPCRHSNHAHHAVSYYR